VRTVRITIKKHAASWYRGRKMVSRGVCVWNSARIPREVSPHEREARNARNDIRMTTGVALVWWKFFR
jgi:hypothetical protein